MSLTSSNATNEKMRAMQEKIHRLRFVLKVIEWGPAPTYPTSECPWCLHQKIDGHDMNCGIGKEL